MFSRSINALFFPSPETSLLVAIVAAATAYGIGRVAIYVSERKERCHGRRA